MDQNKGGGTDLKTSEAELESQPADIYKLQRDRYKLLIDRATAGFYETDRSGVFLFVNDALCTVFGRTRQEMENHRFYDFMSSENAESAFASLKTLGEKDKLTRMTWEIVHKNGRSITLEASVSPVFGVDGRHTGYSGMVNDVTRNILAQESIVKSGKKIEKLYAVSRDTEKRYRAFLRFLPLPLLVQNLDFSIAYLNPAFEETFGWDHRDFAINPFTHIPDDKIKKTRTGKISLLENGAISDLETKRLTKDGRALDVISDGSVFYDQNNQPAGIVVAFRDITQAKKDARTTQSLFKIAKRLHHYGDLDSLLSFISSQVQNLLGVQRTHIILVDDERKEYYFRAGMVKDSKSYGQFSQTRMPLDDSSFAGKIILSEKSRIINDMDKERLRLVISTNKVDNIMGVPMESGSQIIGAMVVTNKIEGKFNQEDVDLLSSVAGIVSLPIENARINDELRDSYEEIKAFNRAKDRIIDHLSHELRTPLSVLSASLGMLAGDGCLEPDRVSRIIARSRRSLKRIVEMESKIKDITHNPYQQLQPSLAAMLELSSDELESLVDAEFGQDAGRRIRQRIDAYFKPLDMEIQHISLGGFVADEIKKLRPDFTSRKIDFITEIDEKAGFVDIPVDVLEKIVTGLVRNSVEYTPDGGRIKIIVAEGKKGPKLTVSDTGVGITQENQQLIFGNYFTTADVSSYGTGKPYAFNAGGSGFDLLRLRVFSERYHFKLNLHSIRCPHLPTNEDICPGSTAACEHCETADHCHRSGGTDFVVQFF